MKNQLKNIIYKSKCKNKIAQKQLYEYTYIELGTSVALYTKDSSERDWVFNIGMLKIFNSLENFKDNTNYLGWAKTILTRNAIDYLRKKTKYKNSMVPIDFSHYNTHISDYETGLNSLETEDIINLIQKLPDNERLIFTMHEIEGYKHTEIEKETRINRNTSKWLLSKAKLTLRSMINNLYNLNQKNNEE